MDIDNTKEAVNINNNFKIKNKYKLKNTTETNKIHSILLSISILIYVWSAINPLDMQSWFLLSIPAVALVIGLVYVYPKFQFSTFVYTIVCFHVIILLIGAKYTYTANPLFEWLGDVFNIERNQFDRVGHFMQGLTPSLMAKEVFIRKENMTRNKMFYYYILSVAMGVSAMYELLEYLATIITNIPGDVVLGLQGDYLDTHKDITMAFVGSLFAMAVLGKFHDRQIDKMNSQ